MGNSNGPISGFVQIVDRDIIPLLEDITKGLAIRSTELAHKFRLVQENCPAICQLLAGVPGLSLDTNVATLVKWATAMDPYPALFRLWMVTSFLS